jgi:hypothetical protein
MISQDLMNVLQFTLEDLETNRTERISPSQQERLKRLRISSMSVPLFFIIVSILILYISITDYSKFNEPSRIVLVLLALLLVVVVFGFAVRRWRRITEDMHSAHVEVLNGTPRLSGLNVKGFGYYSGSYPVTIEDQTILLPYQARSLIDESKVYRFYLTPTVKIILALEEIDQS